MDKNVKIGIVVVVIIGIVVAMVILKKTSEIDTIYKEGSRETSHIPFLKNNTKRTQESEMMDITAIQKELSDIALLEKDIDATDQDDVFFREIDQTLNYLYEGSASTVSGIK